MTCLAGGIVGLSGWGLAIAFCAVYPIAFAVQGSTFTRAISMTPIAATADDDLLQATGTVVETGTGSDGDLLTRVTTHNLEKAFDIQTYTAVKHCNHALHGCFVDAVPSGF